MDAVARWAGQTDAELRAAGSPERAARERAYLAVTERLLREAGTWALLDALAEKVAGRLVERHQELGAVLDRWAADGDFWIRRSALLALLGPLRRGEGDFGRFARYADAMLEETEFFVRKAIGWVLRETGSSAPRSSRRAPS